MVHFPFFLNQPSLPLDDQKSRQDRAARAAASDAPGTPPEKAFRLSGCFKGMGSSVDRPRFAAHLGADVDWAIPKVAKTS